MNTSRRRDSPAGIAQAAGKTPGTWSSLPKQSDASGIPTPKGSGLPAVKRASTGSSGIPAPGAASFGSANSSNTSQEASKPAWISSRKPVTISQPAFTPRSRPPTSTKVGAGSGLKPAVAAASDPQQQFMLSTPAPVSAAASRQPTPTSQHTDINAAASEAQMTTADNDQVMMSTHEAARASAAAAAAGASSGMASSDEQGLLDLSVSDDDLLAACKTPDVLIKQHWADGQEPEPRPQTKIPTPTPTTPILGTKVTSIQTPGELIPAEITDTASGTSAARSKQAVAKDLQAASRLAGTSRASRISNIKLSSSIQAVALLLMFVWCVISTYLATCDRREMYLDPKRFH